MGYAVSAKPTAAMLENEGVGQRSGVRPFDAGVRSQKKLKVRCWSVSRKATVSGATPGPPELPEQPPRARARSAANALRPIRKCIAPRVAHTDRKSTRLNSSHGYISYAVFCLKKKKKQT